MQAPPGTAAGRAKLNYMRNFADCNMTSDTLASQIALNMESPNGDLAFDTS